MLQLIQPLWLFALTGIALPVIIHLWNQRPGKTFKVGSTALVIENAKEYRRSVKLSDILLLLLRCLLIAALALALTSPVWKQRVDFKKQKGWILIPPEDISETYPHFKNEVDSLINAGFEFHYFTNQFPAAQLSDITAKRPDTMVSHYSYWTLLTLLDEMLPPETPVYLFTDNYTKHFSGNRPSLSLSLHWSTYTPPGTANTQQTSSTDTSRLNITIYTDKYTTDAGYVKAAMDALQSVSKRQIDCSIIPSAKEIPAQTDWLFWLSDEKPNKGLKPKNVFSYQNGNPKKITSVINISNAVWVPVRLYRSVSSDSINSTSEIKWFDGFGNAILTKTEKDSVNQYNLYTHFDPAWNELVWSDQFPEILYNLVLNDSLTTAVTDDHRTIDQQQILPAQISYTSKNRSADTFNEIDLTGFSWLLVLIIFFAERFVSFQNSKLKNNG